MSASEPNWSNETYESLREEVGKQVERPWRFTSWKHRAEQAEQRVRATEKERDDWQGLYWREAVRCDQCGGTRQHPQTDRKGRICLHVIHQDFVAECEEALRCAEARAELLAAQVETLKADLEARERDISGWIKQRDEAALDSARADRERDELAAQVEEAREALEGIAEDNDHPSWRKAKAIAREALARLSGGEET